MATANFYAHAGADERRLVKASFFTGVTGGVLWYVLIYYWAALGFTSEQIGLMGGIGSAVGIVTYLFGGYLADKLGRKRLFLVGLASTAAGLVLFLTERNLAVFATGYGLTSLGGSLAWPCLTALMADKATPANVKFFYGIQGFVNQAGLTIATFLAIFTPQFLGHEFGVGLATGYGWVFLATALCAFPPIAYVLKVSETRRPAERLSLHFTKRTRNILAVYCVQNAMIGFGAALVIPWLPVIFKEGMGADDLQVALIITVSNTVVAFGWFVVPKFAELRGSVALIAFSQIASVVPLLAIPYTPFLAALAVAYTVRQFLMLVPSPVLNAYLVNITTQEIRASFLALGQVAWQAAFAAAYPVAGYLWGNDYTRVAPFYMAGALYVAASLVFYQYFKGIDENISARGA